uniref:Putative secreted protein n=1 Tax=Rhipicephalus microplus TaxID=6941 RepID=A0A6G5A3X6_RHIMP
MNRAGGILILLLCGVAISSSYKLREKNDAFDVIFNKEAERRDVEAFRSVKCSTTCHEEFVRQFKNRKECKTRGTRLFFRH